MSSACSNCGKNGHYFRDCREPITSLGILAYKRTDTGLKWLLVRRRVSIGFIELMRGKYELHDEDTLRKLVDQATTSERYQLLTQPFNLLWYELWNGPATRRYHAEYEQARAKFEVLRSRATLARIIAASETAWTEPEWGFPKGRRGTSETEIECALRETAEEAGIPVSALQIVNADPIIEDYRGSNGVRYRHRYWLAAASPELTVTLDPTNMIQQREIGDVRWCTADEALHLIREYSVEKKEVLLEGQRRLGR